MPRSTKSWVPYYIDARERLKVHLNWYPYLTIIAFGLVTILSGHILLTASVRMGHPANLLPFPADSQENGAIWFSVTPIESEIVVATASREVFRWKQNSRSIEDARDFIAWLKQRVRQEIESTALLNQVNSVRSSVVIAADQTLRFAHIRPIIYALAEAGINRYAFETLKQNDAVFPKKNDVHSP